MRHQNSVFHELQKHIPWALFDRLVDKHKADHRVRRLSTKSQFLALLFGQIAGADSLREIEAGLACHKARLYHLGGRCPARTTLADANANRPAAVFCDLFAALVANAGRGLRRAVGDAVYLIDSTGLRLSGMGSEWARFSAGVCGAKMHVIYDAHAERPVYAAVSAARVNDITAAHAMPIEPGATYVFDLGYFDYAWWADLDAARCRIVTRLKKNTPLAVTAELPVPDHGTILSDRIGLLPKRRSKGKANPFTDPVREIRLKAENGAILRIVSNDLDAPANAIAALYKRRWAIELFFRWIKQTLKIRHFLGRSENAVRIQIAVALVAYLLIKLAQNTQKAIASPLAFARLVRLNLMHRRPIDALKDQPPTPPTDPRQLAFELS
ncbi:hypothetical protein GGD81_004667 [Rhodobium orientis]|uniref:IS4 family transposase n=1 Tax=Rhodobium orientis TaxID=34017 RepID=A0A327JJL0_9HYPH|nr:IS4 family transposase [Rhodobium orientis]MBB4305586.1 hypothetical protein [Rhodobium orientis]MBK5950852.1 IS4 family transposase [Rhodobium orientis]RAI24982.1 IS4 family transposase [Rhodobium orientis]